jgi:predicted ATPase
MITKISLSNFKAFKSLNELAIKPITVFCGTNSCGKTSILQSILLTKQTLESQNPSQTILLNGRFVHMGAFENIIFQKNLSEAVSLSFTFKIPKELRQARPKRPFMPLHFLLREFLPTIPTERRFEGIEHYFHFKVSLRKRVPKPRRTGLHTCSVDYFGFRAETITGKAQSIPGASIEVALRESDKYTLNWDNVGFKSHPFMGSEKERIKSGELISKVSFNNFCPASIFRDPSQGDEGVGYIEPLLYRISDFLQNIFGSYIYIGPLREEPSRRYIYENEIAEIGTKGENAAYIYLTEQDREIADHFFFDVNGEGFIQKKKRKLSLAVQDWLNSMNINDFRPQSVREIIYLNLDSAASRKTRVSIADVGFGVSQIFPIILEGLRMPMQSTLILEQPEIHLHPNLQMQMADYFIALALSGKRIIVETHSDHVINRLIRRIVEDGKSNLKDLIAIYFITPTEVGATYKKVEIDDTQGIVNWPKDFFDQTATEQEKIIRAGLAKRRGTSS